MRRTHVVLASIVAVVLAATAAEAQNVVQGTALAVDEINKAGGFPVGDKTYTLQLIALDTRGEPKEAFVQLKRLVEVDGVKYIFGPFLSNVFLAIRPSKASSGNR
jgi:branched-chain amino acid transport system substrate-binding protein